ncbi:hypothetical protein EOS93_25300 [Rhizobium sp. RMa-01]|uniref:hypothetical protein n=1 Tax=unclassified Rhizobium TaxID=2613769 RepID=UPI0008D9BF42|nr:MULTISPECIES: hypothetical protein [unclassified Rhizobium]OHV24924.1 hypothetical protein BBJ66_22535 [Rhizobium sp. RSm-3]RVU08368.1 hypothetical protein EOS93_25300 [Rhizobium sp. RMa-01]
MKLNNFKVEMHTNELFFATWEEGDFRFHVWLDVNGELVNGTLYKNPPISIPFEAEGWFETRYLDAHNKTNSPIIAEVKKRIADRGLIERARLDKQAADYMRQVEREAREIRNYREAFIAAALALGQAGTADEGHFSLHLAQGVGNLSNEAIQAFGRTFIAEIKARSE